jgi:hypothetical protein
VLKMRQGPASTLNLTLREAQDAGQTLKEAGLCPSASLTVAAP